MKLIVFKDGYELSGFLPYGLGIEDLCQYIYDRYMCCWEISNPMDKSLIREVHLYWGAYALGSGTMVCDVMGLSENHSFGLDVVGVKNWLLYKSRDNKIDLLCS